MKNVHYCAPGEIFCRANKVLLAVDGSEGSSRAATVAIELAELTESKLFIIHVIPTPVVEQFSMMSDSDPVVVLEKYEQRGRLLLDGYKKAAEEHKIEVETILERGSISERIIAQSREIGSDIIVIGYEGATGGYRTGLGSATERVLLGTECPVLVVK
ncbi:MAG: universal stress protein [Candidatus Thorarchaeota archaeon]